ncbi:MAG: tRNA (guanosine(37)-N1)-methyltransferase TrmD [Chloroflexi bacterium]|nr:tRNA (guanosine(37)-N1)-methyltransferase TrmD [Chloroflexota bacterium]
MRFDIFTLFPEMFAGAFDSSMLKRARAARGLEIFLHDIRAATTDKHHVTDDTPYAGGGGMIMKPEPIFAAVESVLEIRSWKLDAGNASIQPPNSIVQPLTPIILLSPQGRLFNSTIARELARADRLALICGHYEGVDERVRAHLATDEISIGDYVLTGGEIPAMVIVDAVARFIPGVLGNPDAPHSDSHARGLLKGPQYTRPADFRGWQVPEILLSGNHAQINAWRRREALRRTFESRPELLRAVALSDEEKEFLRALGWQE